MKRLIAGALSAMLLAATLAGCKQGASSSEALAETASADGKVKLTLLSTWEITDEQPVKDETVVGKALEEALGIDLDITYIPEDSLSTKVTAMMSNGTLPDLVFTPIADGTSNFDTINKYGERGYFLNLSEHMDAMPHFKALIEENEEIRKAVTASDGNVYAFPYICDFSNIMYTTPLIREDKLAGSEYTSEGIQTLEDLTGALKYITETTGMPAWIQRDGYDEFMKYSGYLWNVESNVFYDYETDSYTHPVLLDRYREYIEWLRDLRASGVIHPDWTVMSDETWEGMLSADQGFFTIDRMSIIGDSAFSADFDWQPVVYPEIDGKAYLQPRQAMVDTANSWAINGSLEGEKLEKALALMDYMYNPDNHRMLSLGIDGETYTTEDPNTAAGIRWLVQIYGENSDNPESESYLKHGIQAFTRLYREDDILSFPGKYPYVFQEQVEKIEAEEGGFRPDVPALSFTEDELNTRKSLEVSMDTFFDQNIVKFIEGTRDMSEWDSFAQEVKDMGLDEILSIYESAYERYKAK